jgi:DNA-binding PadR family transcriptional regulator
MVSGMSVRDAMLALLEDDEPRTGYRLKTGFEAATGKVWPINVGQIYTTLDRLTRDGLVKRSIDGGQKAYRLTRDGRGDVGMWWKTVPRHDEPPQRDELMIKILIAVTVGHDHALKVIDRQRTAIMRLLQEHRRGPRPTGRRRPTTLADELINDALLIRAEADIRWLDRVEQRLLDERANESGADEDTGTKAG